MKRIQPIINLLFDFEYKNEIPLLIFHFLMSAFTNAFLMILIGDYVNYLISEESILNEIIGNQAVLDNYSSTDRTFTDYTHLVLIICSSILYLISNYFRLKKLNSYLSKLGSKVTRVLAYDCYQSFKQNQTVDFVQLQTDTLTNTQYLVMQIAKPIMEIILSVIIIFFITVGALLFLDAIYLLAFLAMIFIYMCANRIIDPFVKNEAVNRVVNAKNRSEIVSNFYNKLIKIYLHNRIYYVLEEMRKVTQRFFLNFLLPPALSEAPKHILYAMLIVFAAVSLFVASLNDYDLTTNSAGSLPFLFFALQKLLPEFQKLFRSTIMLNTGIRTFYSMPAIYNFFSGNKGYYGTLPELSEQESNQFKLNKILIDASNINSVDGKVIKLPINELEVGKHYALIGPSGCGKTTFAKSLIGLHGEVSSKVSYKTSDNVEIDYNTARSQITYCDANELLVSGSLNAELKLLGLKKLDFEWLAHEILEGLCNDYSEIGELLICDGGSNFSNGQRQRLNLALSLSAKSAFYIFDEALNGVDNDLMSKILTKTNSNQNFGSLWILHNREHLKFFDNIIRLE